MLDKSIDQLTLENQPDGILNAPSQHTQQYVVDDIAAFLNVLPPYVRERLDRNADEDHDLSGLLEVIIDLGRNPRSTIRRWDHSPRGKRSYTLGH